jgi:hypothetical protein
MDTGAPTIIFVVAIVFSSELERKVRGGVLSFSSWGGYWEAVCLRRRMMSTRRFWARPSSVALLATG